MGNNKKNNKRSHTKQACQCAKKKCNTRKISKASSSSVVLKKATRTNHAKDPSLREALEDWYNTPPDKRLTQEEHAAKHGVSVHTFRKYLSGERTLEFKPRGRPSNVDEETTKALIQHSLINAEIVKKLQELIPITPSAAKNYLYRTFPKRLNAKLESKKKAVNAKKKKRATKHALFSNFGRLWFRKPPPTKLDDVNGYRFVQLPKGTSACLQSLVSEHVIEEENEQYVFTCKSNTYTRISKKLSGKQRRQFTRLKGVQIHTLIEAEGYRKYMKISTQRK